MHELTKEVSKNVMGGSIGHNADWSDQPEDFESFCDNFILLPTMVGILLCMARFIDQMSGSQKLVRSVTMRIFKLKPSQMVIVIFIVLTILISGEFYLMRNIFSTTKIQAKDLNPEADLQYGPFDVMSPTLSTFNRELWLSGRIQVNVNQTFSDTEYRRPIEFSLLFLSKSDDGSVDPIDSVQTKLTQRTLICPVDTHLIDGLENYRTSDYDEEWNSKRLKRSIGSENDEPSEYLDELPGHSFDENVASWAVLDPSTDYDDGFIASKLGDPLDESDTGVQYKKTRGIPGDPYLGHGPSSPEDFETNSLRVKEKGVPVWCNKLSLINLKYLNFNQILVNIKSDFGEEIENLEFEFQTINPSFSQLIIWIRFGFLVFGFITTCWFANMLRKLHYNDWRFEQKWISVLLPTLMLFNNPTYALQYLIQSGAVWISFADQLLPSSKY